MRVELFPFAHVFRAGSRIRITVEAPGGNRPFWTFADLPANGRRRQRHRALRRSPVEGRAPGDPRRRRYPAHARAVPVAARRAVPYHLSLVGAVRRARATPGERRHRRVVGRPGHPSGRDADRLPRDRLRGRQPRGRGRCDARDAHRRTRGPALLHGDGVVRRRRERAASTPSETVTTDVAPSTTSTTDAATTTTTAPTTATTATSTTTAAGASAATVATTAPRPRGVELGRGELRRFSRSASVHRDRSRHRVARRACAAHRGRARRRAQSTHPRDDSGPRDAPHLDCRAMTTTTRRGERIGRTQGTLVVLVEAPLRRGGHDRAVHRVCRLRDRVPARRPRLRRHERQLQADPDRGVRRPRRLQPRRQGVHVVHARVPPLSRVGAGDRRVHVRSRPRSRRGVGDLQGHLSWPARPTASFTMSARTAVSSRPCSCTRSNTTSSTPRSCRTSKATARRGRPFPGSRARASR